MPAGVMPAGVMPAGVMPAGVAPSARAASSCALARCITSCAGRASSSSCALACCSRVSSREMCCCCRSFSRCSGDSCAFSCCSRRACERSSNSSSGDGGGSELPDVAVADAPAPRCTRQGVSRGASLSERSYAHRSRETGYVGSWRHADACKAYSKAARRRRLEAALGDCHDMAPFRHGLELLAGILN